MDTDNDQDLVSSTPKQWKELDSFFQADKESFWRVVDSHWAVQKFGGLSALDKVLLGSVIDQLVREAR